MKIRFEEEMGMIPVLRRAEIDSSSLPPDLQSQVQDLLQNRPQSPGEGDDKLRDAGVLRFAIDGDTFELRKWEVPPEARELVDFLRSFAKPVPLT